MVSYQKNEENPFLHIAYLDKNCKQHILYGKFRKYS